MYKRQTYVSGTPSTIATIVATGAGGASISYSIPGGAPSFLHIAPDTGVLSVDDTAAGDVDGDGRLEFVVGFNGGGGVRLLDSTEKMRWRKPDGNVWHVEIADLKGCLLYTSARGTGCHHSSPEGCGAARA